MVIARTVIAGTRAWPVHTDLRDLPAAVAEPAARRYLSVVPISWPGPAQDAVWEALAAFRGRAGGRGAGRPRTCWLEARAAGINVVLDYGMAETCGGWVYAGRPLDGVGVALADDGHGSLIGDPVLFSGYRLRPDLTAASRVDDWLATADRGRWIDGRLEVLGPERRRGDHRRSEG